MKKKENKVNKKQNDTKIKNNKESNKIKVDLKIKNKTESNLDNQSLQNEINNLKQLIEEKNKEIEFLNEDNKNNYNLILLEKQKESLNYENKLEKINKKMELIKVRNEILTKNLNEKDQQITELNNTLTEYKKKISSNDINLKDHIKNSDEKKKRKRK